MVCVGSEKSARLHQRMGDIWFNVLDDPGPIKIPLSPAQYTASTRAVQGSRWLQKHLASALAGGVQRNVDELRGTAVDSWTSLLSCTRYLFFLPFS